MVPKDPETIAPFVNGQFETQFSGFDKKQFYHSFLDNQIQIKN